MPITEEPLDLFLHRPPARLVATILFPTGMTANQLTLVAAVIGVAGGALVGVGTRAAILASAALLWLFLILDCADGELARKQGGGSRLGQVLDGISDYFVAISTHIGFLVLAWRTSAFDAVPRWALFAIVGASGVCQAVHSGLFDAAKTKFRRGLGRNQSGLESRESLLEELKQATTFKQRLILRLYIPYVAVQRRAGAPSEAERAPSQIEFLAWSLLGPTMRMTVIIASVLGVLADPRALVLYPATGLIAANAWMLVMLAWRKGKKVQSPEAKV